MGGSSCAASSLANLLTFLSTFSICVSRDRNGRLSSPNQVGRGRWNDEKRRQILQEGVLSFALPSAPLTPSSQDLFNWSPEYDRGGAEYEKAATIYKNHKEWAKAIYAYTKCAEANDKASLPTKVATALDLKAGCHRDAGQVGNVTY
jgi:hypothetical protein